jgi:predicted ATPase
LAIEVAARVSECFAAGVFFVDLAAATGTETFWTGIASALGMPPEENGLPALWDRLRQGARLLLLDNLEQLPGVGTAIDELLASAPEARVLATSRHPVRVMGEQEYPVPPLPVPSEDTVEALTRSPAAQLFVQQSRLVKPSFTVTDVNVRAVAALCRRLDGLPLALELAAARSKLLTPQALSGRLDRALDLHAIRKGRSPRQQTLRGTITWSYDLLDAAAQRLFRCLAVFPGGASLETIEALWVAVEPNGEDSIEVLQRLVDASMLVVAEVADGAPRVDMLNTIRAYAEERLIGSRDSELARDAGFGVLRELLWHGLRDESPGAWSALTRRLDTEQENYRASLLWSLFSDDRRASERVSDACLLVWGLVNWLYSQRGYRDEARSWCERALRCAGELKSVEVAACHTAYTRMLMSSHDYEAAQQSIDKAHRYLVAPTTRSTLDAEDVALVTWFVANMRVEVAQRRGEVALAERVLRELTDVPAPKRLRVGSLVRLASIRSMQGDWTHACELDSQAYELALRVGEEHLVVWSGQNLACDLRCLGRLEEAEEQMKSVIPRVITCGNPDDLPSAAEDLAAILAERGRSEAAAMLWGAAWAERERSGLPLDDVQGQELAGAIEIARSELDTSWDELVQRGGRVDVRQALMDALK